MRKFNVLILLFLTTMIPLVSATLLGQEAAAVKIRVLLVTGEDHPAHLWREVVPVLRNSLNTDKTIDCRIADDLEILGTDIVFDYDILLCYFKNYAPLKRNEQAKKNLAAFVENGGGLGLLHFTCGAFEDWTEFGQIAGRVWNPKKRAHDPYGSFIVQYVDHDHPITKGLVDFEISDELYTCLKDSALPILVLAEATSKVDKQQYPMIFVLEKGKGRIFHTTLGHNVQSVSTPDFKILLQRAVLWLNKRM